MPSDRVELKIMGQEIDFPADKWTAVVISLIGCTAIVCCCWIIFVRGNVDNVREFFSKPPVNETTQPLSLQFTDDFEDEPVIPEMNPPTVTPPKLEPIPQGF